MKLSSRFYVILVLIPLALSSITCTSGPIGSGASPTPREPLSAKLTEISGLVQVMKSMEGLFKDAFNGQTIEVKDQVLTHQDSRVRIDLSNGTMFRVGPFSTFILDEMEYREDGPFAKLKLDIGKLWIILRGGAVDVETPAGLASVRGSYLYVEVLPVVDIEFDEPVTSITCLEGTCTLECEGGKVTLGAGETGTVTDPLLPPVEGKMTDEQVDEWVKVNPEAAEVIPQLTATPTSTKEEIKKTPTKTWTPTKTYTPTTNSETCGPPTDWVIYTVESGDTLWGISEAFGISKDDLQFANCMGDSTTLTVGDNIFVPNVPTKTPTSTKTPKPYKTSTPKPTKTPTKTLENTEIPPDSNAVFFNIEGPPETITECLNYYKTDVIDPDGISMVKLWYIVDPLDGGTKTEPANGEYVVMDFTNGNSYEKPSFKIPTWETTGTDKVYYRFRVYDKLGHTQFYPALTDSPYFYYDSLNCSVNYPTTFSGHLGPGGETPISLLECANNYEVKVEDANGIVEVGLEYSVAIGPYQYQPLDLIAGNLYLGTWGIDAFIIETVGETKPVEVSYKFKAKDKLGNLTYDNTNIFFFTDDIGCPLLP